MLILLMYLAGKEKLLIIYIGGEYKGDLRPLVFSMGFVADEVVRTGMTLFPFLSVGFVIMCGFSIGTVALSGLHFRQFSRQKVIMAIIACCCPLFACATALGLLFWFGVRFGTILCVSPFLVLAIGVDDAFLMLQSWQRICSLAEQLNEEEKEENNNLIELEEKLEKLICKRLGQMLEDVGPSVTITSATNFLAFCVGIFTPTPEIQLFCAGNASAIFVDYIYQLFLFTPFLAISAKREMKENAKKRYRHTLPVQRRFFLKISQKLAQFLRAYCRWISSGFTATLVATTLLIFWGLSAKWASRAIPNITPRKLFLADSPLNEIIALKDEYIMPSYMPVSIFIEKVGDLRNHSKMERIQSLIETFEKEPNNMGAPFTHFWLRDYERYLASEIAEEENDEEIEENNQTKNQTSKQPSFRHSQMSSFLGWPEYRHWNGFLRFNKNGHLENQIETLVPATVQSSIATLLCMSIVCSVFMSNIFTVAIATICIVSICLGAFGLLVLWGIDLDPISMATTIMSIGFSVDFPAHVTYHYYRCSKFDDGRMLSPEQRVHASLLAIGFPLLQCGMSTILFVLCLLFVDTYMSEVFVKSMFLVVSLGLIHGLFVVPSMLCALSNINLLLETIKKQIFSPSNHRPFSANAKRKNSINSYKLQRKSSSKLVISVVGPG
uniref:SSD domain-containing protein n=1 Tax=Meloidogyne enterolobii TaxID=390850 RepID=A0A6V7VYK4_MELEN|nr:unnamed protein product [Meloidogyne enterolobii]